MRTIVLMTAAFSLAPAALAQSQPIPDLLRAKNCLTCHATASRVMGPSFKEVAGKYRGVPGAQETLASKVRRGGAGVWGTIPMPPNNQLSEEEARLLVSWILTH